MVGGDLEQLSGRAQAMNFIEHNPLASYACKKTLRVIQPASFTRQFAIDVLIRFQAFAEGSLASPPHTGEPNHGAVVPGRLNSFKPVMALYEIYHVQLQ